MILLFWPNVKLIKTNDMAGFVKNRGPQHPPIWENPIVRISHMGGDILLCFVTANLPEITFRETLMTYFSCLQYIFSCLLQPSNP